METVGSALRAWETFYVIVGSSAAALTGLQFVVIALVAERRTRSTMQEIGAFGTPTVVHFALVLLISAILSAPWPAMLYPAVAVAVSAFSGAAYVLVVIRRARRQKGYTPVVEDWLWHTVFPLLAYAGAFTAALELPAHAMVALFVIAGATLLLLFCGIHNAWDTVTFIVIAEPSESAGKPRPAEGDQERLSG